MANEIDITKNIKIIESFKCEILNSVAQLFSAMNDNKTSAVERSEILANILTITYLLSDRLGTGFNALDSRAVSRIRLGLLSETGSDEWKASLNLLKKHLVRD